MRSRAYPAPLGARERSKYHTADKTARARVLQLGSETQGNRKEAALIVRDLMTPSPIAAPAETSVASAIALLEPMELRHLPIVDLEGNLQGIVSERDLHSFFAPRPELAGNWAELLSQKLEEPVSRIMVTPAITLDEETPLANAIDRMLETRVTALPVVSGTRLVGILSYVDVLRAVSARLAAS
jgi:CBS domain-containing protein